MSACAVVGCKWPVRYEELCVPPALPWLVSKDSDRTPGREDRLRAFIARSSARNFSESRATISQEGST